MRISSFLTTALMFVISGTSAFADISGLYVRESQTSFEAIQIVESTGGSLSGKHESYSLSDTGTLSSTSVGFDGSISKHQLILHLRKSLETLFTTQSISGEARSGSLYLQWEGGAGTFTLAQAEQRDEAIERLTVLGAQIAWLREVERTQRRYDDATVSLHALTAEAEALDVWMAAAISNYDDLAKRYAKTERHRAALAAARMDSDLQFELEDKMYGLESEFYSLESEVEGQRSSLRWKAHSIGLDIAHVEEFCSAQTKRTKALRFCDEQLAQSEAIRATVSDLSALFSRWDSRRA
tara:strand:+ start:8125 stop:9012 length:888 start_codon:yes stop_codon:yes gene_type:complete